MKLYDVIEKLEKRLSDEKINFEENSKVLSKLIEFYETARHNNLFKVMQLDIDLLDKTENQEKNVFDLPIFDREMEFKELCQLLDIEQQENINNKLNNLKSGEVSHCRV